MGEPLNFTDLPDELALAVVGRLPPEEIASFSAVSKRYQALWNRDSAFAARISLLQVFHSIIHEFDAKHLSLAQAMAFLIELSADCRRQNGRFQDMFVKAVRLCIHWDDVQGALVLSWLIGLNVYELRDIPQGFARRCQRMAEDWFCDEKTNPALKNIFLPFVSKKTRHSFISSFYNRVSSGVSEAYCCFANIHLSPEAFIALSSEKWRDVVSLFGVSVRSTSEPLIRVDIHDWQDARFASFEGLRFDIFNARKIDGLGFVNCAFEGVLFHAIITHAKFRRCSFRQVSFAEGQQFSEASFVRCRLDSPVLADLYRAGIRDFRDFQQLDSAVVANFFGIDFKTVKLPEVGWVFSDAQFNALAICSLYQLGVREFKGLQTVNANFQKLEMSGLTIWANDVSIKFQNSRLSRLDVQTYGQAPQFILVNCTLIDCLFFHHGAAQSSIYVRNCLLDEDSFRNLLGEGVKSFVDCRFLPGTSFRGLDISDCDFTGAVLRGVDLRGCRFNHEIIFIDADLIGTIWSGVGSLLYAYQSNFKGTLFDRKDSAPSSLFNFIARAMIEAHYDDRLGNAHSDYFVSVLYVMLSMYVDERCHHAHRASAREMMAIIDEGRVVEISRYWPSENKRVRSGRFSRMLQFFAEVTVDPPIDKPGVLPSLDPLQPG